MKLPQASHPHSQLNRAVQVYIYFLVAVFIVMVTLQLITFEKFIPIIDNYQLPGALSGSKAVAGVIVASEVLALPFLLRMRLSRLMRLLSAAMLLLSAMIWLGLGVWSLTNSSPLTSSGITGSLLGDVSAPFIVVYGLGLVAASLSGIFLLRRDLFHKKSV